MSATGAAPDPAGAATSGPASATPSPGGEGLSRTAVAALQRMLAAEHAAVYVYGTLGARTSRSSAPAAYQRIVDAYRVHQQRRDDLVGVLDAAGVEPVRPEPGYDLSGLDGPDRIRRRARALEEDCAATYAYGVASTTGDQRAWAADALVDAAVRGLGFGGRPEVLPGT